MTNRRLFVKTIALGGLSLPFTNSALGSALGSNDRINVAVIGVANRGKGLLEGLGDCKGVRVSHICDVDNLILADSLNYAKKTLGYLPTTERDFRRVLENREVDAVVIATPDHWHAPMSLLAMQAGKHVYVEKPCSHTIQETSLLIKAQKRSGMYLQMGNQQRSSKSTSKAIRLISEGVIGKPYLAKAFYYNSRGSIGNGKVVDAPDQLNWDLWQGPAPRENYRDNIHPYNWHWFKTWGTGEIHNNGTHEIDVCRWALGAGYPISVQSSGGRYHFEGDDWQFPDTQLVQYEYQDSKMLIWEGISCNGYTHKKGRGVEIRGTGGSIFISRRKFVQYNREGKEVRQVKETDHYAATSTSDTLGFDGMTVSHLRNFVNTVRGDEKLNSSIAEASISTNLCHLGNIAQETQERIYIDQTTGLPKSGTAQSKVKREYAAGWEPEVW